MIRCQRLAQCPATADAQRGVLLSSQRGMFVERPMADTDVCDLVLRQFGI
jgi:hypothetical protein